MQPSINMNSFDEFMLGIMVGYGEDQNGESIRVIEIGFLFFTISFTEHLTQ